MSKRAAARANEETTTKVMDVRSARLQKIYAWRANQA
jgi:hypothetical protein